MNDFILHSIKYDYKKGEFIWLMKLCYEIKMN
jgi:hypothetical protein